MARCPFALWKPLPENSSQGSIDPTQVIFHSAVDAEGPTDLWRWFNRVDVRVESHFWVRLDGTLEQFMDTEVRADANYSANKRAISIETEDDGNPNARAWTPAQVETLVRLGEWIAKTHGIPARVCPDHDEAGFGWHSQFGAPGPWTPSRGKTCPGAPRIRQVPSVVDAIAQRLDGKGPEPDDRPPLLRRGDRGPEVREFQVLLNSKGLASLTADGVFGPNTEAAVKDAQRKVGVEADGIVGPKTRAAVEQYRRPPTKTIRRGDKGASVAHAQDLLGITADGDFGPKTEKAVKAFQRAEGLSVDGIVGPNTWEALRD